MAGKYTDIIRKNFDYIKMLARDGYSDKDIAERLAIPNKLFQNYKVQLPELGELLKENKEIADARVENAMYKKAIGYYYEEEKIIYDSKGRPKKELLKKYAQPDFNAQLFWLKNRNPKKWVDIAKIDLNAELVNPLDKISTEDLVKLLSEHDGE